MNKPLIIASVAAAFILANVAALVSQPVGTISSGSVLGNGTAGTSSVGPYPLGSVMDQALGNTNGCFAVRGVALWSCRIIAGSDLPAPTPSTRGGILSTQIRELLTTTRSYFVRTDGSDSNDCLSNTAPGACLTIQHAIDLAVALDNNGFAVGISVANGTYATPFTLKNYVGSGVISITGNAGTPSSVFISTTTAAITAVGTNRPWSLNGFKTQTSSSGHNHIIVQNSGTSLTLANWEFGSAVGAGGHMLVNFGGSIVINGNTTISGSANHHHAIASQGIIQQAGATITLTGTPAWGQAFLVAGQGSIGIFSGNTYSGAATGTRFLVSQNSSIDPPTACANFPGSVAGTNSTGGLCP